YVRDVLNKATMKDGSIDGSGLLQRIYSKKGGMGEDALKHIFDKNELSQIRGVATALKVSQGRQAEGAGGMLIQLTQAGAVAGLAYGQFPKAAGVLLIGPKALSSIMLNPIASKWLSTGLKAPKITPNVLAAMTRLTSLSERIEKTASNQNDQFETQ
ncbi:MAG: hypothetical protein PF495_15715, partial [Spirochaetales bacterium]|nr:hypothetical protein [Spirochaetales bacterium]